MHTDSIKPFSGNKSGSEFGKYLPRGVVFSHHVNNMIGVDELIGASDGWL